MKALKRVMTCGCTILLHHEMRKQRHAVVVYVTHPPIPCYMQSFNVLCSIPLLAEVYLAESGTAFLVSAYDIQKLLARVW